ncbi:fumarylacetoacetate hydrolase family protein [Marivita sp. S6314]|uniref:fumarylacetoacetate hydrolase family protein n=1 Tax=Marivita sp. S6314 TaxID=2926406 RepID=UPI001FF68480|nr:fumarylacetoacetate hydrolase family protein [Marivita sp. S6314]MCK0150171.1 fumarylacetoacetate hydrolase family protein [Marivita sp. S6314]
MKYLVGETSKERAVFAVTGEKAVNLTTLNAEIGTDLMALARDPGLIDTVKNQIADAPTVSIDAITPALPIAHPGKILCLGLNYTDHVKEGGYDIPDYPAFFMRGRNSVMASGAPLVRPSSSDQLDYEAELMFIIGTGGRHIREDTALNHVFGYTTFNDGSIRDFQNKTHQWTPGKNFDSTGAIGPIVVTPDELPTGASGLNIESRVGDEILQSSTTSNMFWSVAQSIATISEFATLEPGDMIAMGTPPGVGMAKTPTPRWLKPGETIEVEIEGIGVCANPVVDESDLQS